MTKRITPVILVLFFVLAAFSTVAAQEATADPDFPVTVEHKYGSTTITQAPERVVSIGYTDQDALFALGVTPIAIRYWYGDETNAVFPWAQDEAGDAVPEVQDRPLGEALEPLNLQALDSHAPGWSTRGDASMQPQIVGPSG